VACKKHNISPRPTTEDICLSTFRAITHSTCMNICDSDHNIVEDACGAIAGTTWIPKHNAFRACKTGYKMATQQVPGLIEAASEHMTELHEALGWHEISSEFAKAEKDRIVLKATEIKIERSEAAEGEEVLSAEELDELVEEYEFPITIDDGSVQTLVIASNDDVEKKVMSFCEQHMGSEPGCVQQLLPIVKDRMENTAL